jgi:hypothetical protein
MIGENLFNAVNVVTKAGIEISAMYDKIYSMLENKLPETGQIKKVNDQEFVYEDYDGDWACRGCLKNFGLYKKGSKNADAFLGIQVKLFDLDESKIVGPTPLLYVLFSSGYEWKENEFKVSKVFDEENTYELENDCIWQWYDEGEEHGAERDFEKAFFAYVIPLVEINSSEDIAELIIEPIKMTILGKNIGTYLNSKSKVLKFISKNGEVTLKSLPN